MRAALPVLLLAGVGCATALRDKGMEQSTATYEALREVRSARRHAVLVGVDTYEDPSFTRLKHARDDARVLSELFGAPETGGFHEVHLIEDATRGQFFEALRTVRDLLRPPPRPAWPPERGVALLAPAPCCQPASQETYLKPSRA